MARTVLNSETTGFHARYNLQGYKPLAPRARNNHDVPLSEPLILTSSHQHSRSSSPVGLVLVQLASEAFRVIFREGEDLSLIHI